MTKATVKKEIQVPAALKVLKARKESQSQALPEKKVMTMKAKKEMTKVPTDQAQRVREVSLTAALLAILGKTTKMMSLNPVTTILMNQVNLERKENQGKAAEETAVISMTIPMNLTIPMMSLNLTRMMVQKKVNKVTSPVSGVKKVSSLDSRVINPDSKVGVMAKTEKTTMMSMDQMIRIRVNKAASLDSNPVSKVTSPVKMVSNQVKTVINLVSKVTSLVSSLVSKVTSPVKTVSNPVSNPVKTVSNLDSRVEISLIQMTVIQQVKTDLIRVL